MTPDGNGVVSFSAGDSLPDLEELRSYDSLVSFDFGTREPDLDYLHELRTIFPDCDIRFEMQIGGKKYGADTVSIVSPALTADDVKKLSALKELQTVDARGSACVEELKLYASEHPECIVCYSETVFGEEVSNLDTYLDLSDKRVRIDQLKSVLDDHPNLTDVNLIGCSLDNSEKYDLHASYPGITFYWNIYYGDETFRTGFHQTVLQRSGRSDPADRMLYGSGICGCFHAWIRKLRDGANQQPVSRYPVRLDDTCLVHGRPHGCGGL